MRRVIPWKRRMKGGGRGSQYPTSQHQNETLPQNSSSVKPNTFGNQKLMPAKQPNTTPPMITLWQCATRNSLLCSRKSAPGTASNTPVMPPTAKVTMKPIVHNVDV